MATTRLGLTPTRTFVQSLRALFLSGALGGPPVSHRPAAESEEASTRIDKTGALLCLAGAAFGVVGFVGWIAHAEALTTIIPGRPPMMPSTAVMLCLLGLGGALRYRSVGRRAPTLLSKLAASIVLVGGVLIFSEYVFRVDLGIDHLLLGGAEPGPYRGRPSPPTALSLSLLAAALLMFDTRLRSPRRPTEWLVVGAWIIAFTALLGHLFGAGALYRLAGTSVIGVALFTALGLLSISAGLLMERPGGGFMALLASASPGGVLLRRLLIPAIIAPATLGLVFARLFAALGMGDFPILVAALTTSITAVGPVLLTITAKRLNEAHEALEASRTLIRDLVEEAPDGIFTADLNGRYTDVNDAGCRLLGYSWEEIVGMSIVDLLLPDQIPRLKQSRERLLSGSPDLGEWELRRKDGSFVSVEVSAKILADGRWQGLVRNIGERKRLEQALHDLVVDLNRAQAVAQVGSWRLDVRNNELRWSDESYRIFGVAPGTPMTYEGFLSRVHPDDRDSVHTQWNAALRGEPYDIEHRLLVDGTVKWVREKAELDIDESGALRGAIGITHDLTMRKVLEEKLHRAMRAREDVLGIVAHDLRNPLHIIDLQTRLLRRHAGGPERRAQEPLDRIHTGVARMNRLIQDLLEVSKAEMGQLTVECRPLDAGLVIEAVVDSQRQLAQASGINLDLHVADGLPQVWADRDRLAQILENLVGNAMKFTPRGGHIAVRAVVQGEEVLFQVEDSGRGMCAEDLPHVFDRFWQSRRDDGRGAGLGLAIVKALVDAQAGRIWVESEDGRGSTFSFTLQRAATGRCG